MSRNTKEFTYRGAAAEPYRVFYTMQGSLAVGLPM